MDVEKICNEVKLLARSTGEYLKTAQASLSKKTLS